MKGPDNAKSLGVMTQKKYTCACCGYRTLTDSPGSYEICPVCFWEDDPVQLLDPWFRGGANTVSLAEAQRNFAEAGASESRFRSNVQSPNGNLERDPSWRAVVETDRKLVRTPAQLEREQPNAKWKWYYWEHDA